MADTEQERKVEWRVREGRGFRAHRFSVDTVTDPALGQLRLIADNLTEPEAHMIAAAPDLLEALRAIMGDLNSAEDLSDVVGRFVSTEFYHRAAAAIARATGVAS